MKGNRRQELSFRRAVSGFVATCDISLCCYDDYGLFSYRRNSKSRFVKSKYLCQRIKTRFAVCISFWWIQKHYKEMDVMGPYFKHILALISYLVAT